MNSKIYIEGGGDSKELHVRCRQGFRNLLQKCGFEGRMPRLIACGGRAQTYGDFRVAHNKKHASEFVAMLIDSEEAVLNVDKTWNHLKKRDGWEKPKDATDEQVFFMATCMETWIMADIESLKKYYGSCFQQDNIPSLNNLETLNRKEVQEELEQLTKNCKNAFQKGKRSFDVLGNLNPNNLEGLKNFSRMKKILNEKLKHP